MCDPHVSNLIFHLKTDGSVVFERARALIFSTEEFNGELKEGELDVMMMAHYATEAAARSVVEPYLRAWEMNTLLDGCYSLQFVFVRSEVVDRKPPPPGEHNLIGAHAHASSTSTALASAVIVRSTYPSPPVAFSRSPLVVGMVDRLKQYIAGGESLFSAAYYCITAIENATADMAGAPRKNAAAKFRIELEVLKTLGELSSERGGPLEARKAGRRSPTGSERQWLEAALRRVIRQVASVEGGETLSQLSMSDLPAIPPQAPA